MEQIDWLAFNRLGIEINLSTSIKRFKEQILEKIQSIVNDLDLIATDTFATEILVEYKKNLNVSLSIKAVRERKSQEKAEADRLQMQIVSKRTAQLRTIGLVYHDLTRTFNWMNDESVMVKNSDVETLNDSDWIKKYSEIEGKVKRQTQIPFPAPLQAPTVEALKNNPPQEAQPEIFEAKFMVSDTYDRLMLLSKFLKDNRYNYINID